MNFDYSLKAVFSPRYRVCRQEKSPFHRLEPDGFLVIDDEKYTVLWLSSSGITIKRKFSSSYTKELPYADRKAIKARFCLIEGCYYAAVLSFRTRLALYDTNSSIVEEFCLPFSVDKIFSCTHGLLLTSLSCEGNNKEQSCYLIMRKFDVPLLLSFRIDSFSNYLEDANHQILSICGSIVLCLTTFEDNSHVPSLTLWVLEVDNNSSRFVEAKTSPTKSTLFPSLTETLHDANEVGHKSYVHQRIVSGT
jgi:hypothetical protein